MEIWLDGQRYVLSPNSNVIRSPIMEWPDNVRLDGQQQRKDRRYLSSWSIDDVSGGLGKEVDYAGGNRLWDVENVDTRWPGQKILSPNIQSVALPDSNIGWVPFEWNGDFLIAAQQQGNGPTHNVFKWSPTTFTFVSYGNLILRASQTTATYIHDIRVMGNSPPDIVCFADQVYKCPTLCVAGTVISTLNVVGARGAALSDLGGTLHGLIWNSTNGVYSFLVGNSIRGSIASVLDQFAPCGTYVAPLVTDGAKVYAALPDGIWDFDATPQKLIEFGGDLDLNPQAILFRNFLFFKHKQSAMLYDGTNVVKVGYDRDAGLRSALLGEIHALATSYQWIFAAIKGATYSHIITFDGVSWQYYARWPTSHIPSSNLVEKMVISSQPDSITRLWCFEKKLNTINFFLNPLVNPLQAGTYHFVGTGYYTPPVFAGGIPEELGGWYRALVIGDSIGLVGGTNSVTIRYGLDGEAPNTRLLGAVVTTNGALVFGSPSGVQAYRIQPRIELMHGGGAEAWGTTPVVRDVVIQYLKDPAKRYTYDCEIDIDQTAKQWMRPKEAVIGSLNYVGNLKTLAPFWYGQMGTTYVKVLDYPAGEATPETKEYPKERSGYLRIRLAEIIPF